MKIQKRFRLLPCVLLVIAALLTGAGNAGAQTAIEFPTENAAFLSALKKFMLQGENKEMKDFFENFEEAWLEAPFDIYKPNVIAFCNEMGRKKYRATPHFTTYLQSVMNFYHGGLNKQNFDSWEKGLQWMIRKKSGTYMVEYLEFSAALFSKNALHASDAHIWYSNSKDFKILFDEPKSEISIAYTNVSLRCEGKNDSTHIENTSGIFYPLEQRFEGTGGILTWERVGLPKTETFAEFRKYSISTKRSTFKADSVRFHNLAYFPTALEGKLEEKLTSRGEDDASSYPKFDSYTRRFEIKNVFENVDYEGGFSFHGSRFIAKGDSSNQALFKFYREGTLFLKASSQNFALDENKFTSNRASITIYLGEDSIYHPGLDFKFLKKEKEISLLRLGEGTVQTPFYNSYHGIEMYIENLTWKMDQAFMSVSSSRGSAQNVARFRSENFFNDVEYERMQGMDDIHPLTKLGYFLKDKNNNQPTFTALDYAKYLKIDLSQTRQLLMRFSISGLIAYNIDTEIGTVTNRFYHFINSAARRTDYDVIEIYSQMGQNTSNALLSLLDYRLDIKGVGAVIVSDSQKVEIRPYGSQLTLKKKMDFSFNGIILAGRWAAYGTNFNFFYKDFKFKMVDVDSVKILARAFKKNERGEFDDVLLKSTIEDLSGEILIDHANNKSGLKAFPEYPSFISTKKSYVYYNSPKIEKGVYPRDRFYFQLDQFKKDTLDNFQSSYINFDGSFVSAGIFPDLREKLIIMPDYSLGLFRITDSKGLSAYGGKGLYNDTLTLSLRGLRGAGKIEYLTSKAWSHDFSFYPDSMNAFAYRFGIKKQKGGVETPDVKATNVDLHWEPQNDRFEVTESDSPFEMYESQSTMRGLLTLTPTGLKGDGEMSFGNASLNSNIFNFKSDDFKSDTSSFALTDVNTEGRTDTSQVAFKTDNVKADVTFTGRKGSFKSNSPDSYVEFPINKFKAYMEEMEWYMDKQEVDLNSRKVDEIGLKGALFVSTDPRLDSLSFVAPQAKFVLEGKEINCGGVKFLDIADSRIFPVDEKVIIRKDAKIDPFVDAKIWVGKTDKIHILEHANITVFTSHKYSGTADYNYVDELGKAQVIKFNKVDVDEKDVTMAEGVVEQILDFAMSTNFLFKGKVNLYGKNPLLTFDGYTKITHLCQNMKHDWFRFTTEIDPNNIMIPVPSEPQNDQQAKLFNGFLFASDSTGIYPAVFTPKIRYSDYNVLYADGYLSFDKKTQEFRISRKEKLQDRELPGNYLAFNTNTCASYGEGQMELGAKLGQVDLKCAGSVTHEPAENNIAMDIVLTVAFKLEAGMMKMMEEKIRSSTGTGADINDDQNKRAITDLLDSARADKLYNGIGADGKFKRLPKELSKTLVLTDLHLVWDKSQRSLLHNGTVGVMVFNGEQVNKSATALVELNRKTGGDMVTIYLEFDETNWYYLQYRNNLMYIYSGVKEFNELLTSLDINKRQFQQEGLPMYQIAPGSNRRVTLFKEKFGIVSEK